MSWRAAPSLLLGLLLNLLQPLIARADPSAVYATIGKAELEREDGPVKKCEIFVPLAAMPETVALRVKTLVMGEVTIRSFTVDVIQFGRISNGIPFDPQSKPITSARIIANTFDSGSVTTKIDMGDGGVGYNLGEKKNLTALLALLRRGEYYLMFKRSDKSDETAYAVGNGIEGKVIGSFEACVSKM